MLAEIPWESPSRTQRDARSVTEYGDDGILTVEIVDPYGQQQTLRHSATGETRSRP